MMATYNPRQKEYARPPPVYHPGKSFGFRAFRDRMFAPDMPMPEYPVPRRVGIPPQACRSEDWAPGDRAKKPYRAAFHLPHRQAVVHPARASGGDGLEIYPFG